MFNSLPTSAYFRSAYYLDPFSILYDDNTAYGFPCIEVTYHQGDNKLQFMLSANGNYIMEIYYVFYPVYN